MLKSLSNQHKLTFRLDTREDYLSRLRAHLDSTTAAGKAGPSPQPSPHPLRRRGSAASRMGRGRTANPVNRRRVSSHPVPLSIRWKEGESLACGLVVLTRCASQLSFPTVVVVGLSSSW